MKNRFRAAWNVLRGRPTLYGVTFVGTATVTNRYHTIVQACQFRIDAEGKGGLRVKDLPEDQA